jgi:nucleoside 2-deoxyribosyltransferase
MAVKKYQVFISSTFRDLEHERNAVLRAILDLGHIPAGMELFPAADEEQFSYIRQIIDECDYCILVIAGRYGSIAADGISFTEKEYDYAVAKKIPILAFIHDSPNDISSKFVDHEQDIVEKLNKFKNRVSANSLVQYRGSLETLQLKVNSTLSRTFTRMPGVGWVRGNTAASEDILNDLNNARNKIDALTLQLSRFLEKEEEAKRLLEFEKGDFDLKYKMAGTNQDQEPHSVTLRLGSLIPTVLSNFVQPNNFHGVNNGVLAELNLIHKNIDYHKIQLINANEITRNLLLLELIEVYSVETNKPTVYLITKLGRQYLLDRRH